MKKKKKDFILKCTFWWYLQHCASHGQKSNDDFLIVLRTDWLFGEELLLRSLFHAKAKRQRADDERRRLFPKVRA